MCHCVRCHDSVPECCVDIAAKMRLCTKDYAECDARYHLCRVTESLLSMLSYESRIERTPKVILSKCVHISSLR
jgi:hypothetical protein